MMMEEDGSIQRERGSYCPTLSTQRARQLIGEACYLAGTRSLWRGFTETERTREREKYHIPRQYTYINYPAASYRQTGARWLTSRPAGRGLGLLVIASSTSLAHR